MYDERIVSYWTDLAIMNNDVTADDVVEYACWALVGLLSGCHDNALQLFKSKEGITLLEEIVREDGHGHHHKHHNHRMFHARKNAELALEIIQPLREKVDIVESDDEEEEAAAAGNEEGEQGKEQQDDGSAEDED
jgi:hypothetical protein